MLAKFSMQLSLSISLPDEEPSLESDGFFLLSLSAILHMFGYWQVVYTSVYNAYVEFY